MTNSATQLRTAVSAAKGLIFAALIFPLGIASAPAFAVGGNIQMLPPVNEGTTTPCTAGTVHMLTWDGASALACSNELTVTGGNVTTTGSVTIGDSTATCSATNAGAIKFDATAKVFLGCDGTNWTSLSAQQGTNLVSYTTPGTYSWPVPSGVTKIEVEVWGGGGGASGGIGGAAGGGGYAEGSYTVTPGTTYSVVVGAGGGAVMYSVGGPAGGDGGSSSLGISTGTIISATGGAGGAGGGGVGGVGSGGQLNLWGGTGLDVGAGVVGGVSFNTYGGAPGGASPRGGPGGMDPGIASIGYSAIENGQQPGGGGGASIVTAGDGAAGAVMIRY